MRSHLVALMKFASASAAGLALDYAVYAVLCGVGVRPTFANMISASCAVTLVFFISAHRIFDRGGHFLGQLFAIYALYQVAAIALASLAVGAMTDVFDGLYLVGKSVVVPFSFGMNYLFAHWLFSASAGTQTT